VFYSRQAKDGEFLQKNERRAAKGSIAHFKLGTDASDIVYTDLVQHFRGRGSIKTSVNHPYAATILTCPASGNGQETYYVDAAVVAENDEAGFATYGCTEPGIHACTPSIARMIDDTGAPFNFIGGPRFPIAIASTNITILVYGWGDYDAQNDFQLDISVHGM